MSDKLWTRKLWTPALKGEVEVNCGTCKHGCLQHRKWNQVIFDKSNNYNATKVPHNIGCSYHAKMSLVGEDKIRITSSCSGQSNDYPFEVFFTPKEFKVWKKYINSI